MDTHKKIREHISALSDGALPECDVELAFAALQTADGEHAWNTYHRIGDVLRSQAAPELSTGFASTLAARLAAEADPGRRSPRAAPLADGAGRRGAAGVAAAASAVSAATDAASASPSGPLPDVQAIAQAQPAIVSVS